MKVEVVRSRRRTLCASVKDGVLTVRAPLFSSDADIARFLEKHRAAIDKLAKRAEQFEREKAAVRKLSTSEIDALYEKARAVVPERVAHFAPLVGVTYGRITIRRQRSRWGSCSSKGNLGFNCLLMLTPPEVIDSVVVHELCHRKEMNHSRRFYAEVLRVFPDYRKADKWLKENGKLILASVEE